MTHETGEYPSGQPSSPPFEYQNLDGSWTHLPPPPGPITDPAANVRAGQVYAGYDGNNFSFPPADPGGEGSGGGHHGGEGSSGGGKRSWFARFAKWLGR